MKIIFFIPAILFVMIFVFVVTSLGISSIEPRSYVWLALILIAGILLSKDQFWGGFIGIFLGILTIYSSTKETGQIIDIELPIGVMVVIYYVLCSGFVIFKKAKRKKIKLRS